MARIVVSGVNLKEGGILSVLEDCLYSLKKLNASQQHEVFVMVHKLDLIKKGYLNCFNVREFPTIKESWRRRLKFEFSGSLSISKQLKPDIWISLHDITPNVACKYQVVYCHNPSPFYKLPVSDYLVDITFTLFNAFYKYLYGLNIKKNKYVIIQQNWLRDEFYKRYNVNSIVAYPQMEYSSPPPRALTRFSEEFCFFYPSFPRVFKNFEVLLAAADELTQRRLKFKVVVTIKEENKYSKKLYDRYRHNKNIAFIGLVPREKVFELYQQTDCLVFPSKLETWGLPLSEIKNFGKPVLAADLEYAHESLGEYKKIKFFSPDNFIELADHMEQIIKGQLIFDENTVQKPSFPFFENWDDLLSFIIKDAAQNS